jgi:hypothetical protein
MWAHMRAAILFWYACRCCVLVVQVIGYRKLRTGWYGVRSETRGETTGTRDLSLGPDVKSDRGSAVYDRGSVAQHRYFLSAGTPSTPELAGATATNLDPVPMARVSDNGHVNLVAARSQAWRTHVASSSTQPRGKLLPVPQFEISQTPNAANPKPPRRPRINARPLVLSCCLLPLPAVLENPPPPHVRLLPTGGTAVGRQ